MNLVKEIINVMPKNLDEIEKARYIYIELCKKLEFSQNTMMNTEKKHYELEYNKVYDIKNINDLSITCNNWADIYVELLKLVDVKAKKIKTPYDHAYVIVKANEILINTDATAGFSMDLSKIKQSRKPKNFVPLEDEDIPINEFEMLIDKIDDFLGYSEERKQASNNLKKLQKEIETKENIFEKIKTIFLNINLSDFGFFEGSDYIRYVINFCLDEEKYDIKFITISRTNPDLNIESLKCITISKDNKVEYYIFVPHTGIRKATKEDLFKLSQMGYGIEGDKIIIGDSSIEKFKIYKNTKIDKIRLQKEQLYLKKYIQEEMKNINKTG